MKCSFNYRCHCVEIHFTWMIPAVESLPVGWLGQSCMRIKYNALQSPLESDTMVMELFLKRKLWLRRNVMIYFKAQHSNLGPFSVCCLAVSSDYAQPTTGQVTELTCSVIGRAQPLECGVTEAQFLLCWGHFPFCKYILLDPFRHVHNWQWPLLPRKLTRD